MSSLRSFARMLLERSIHVRRLACLGLAKIEEGERAPDHILWSWTPRGFELLPNLTRCGSVSDLEVQIRPGSAYEVILLLWEHESPSFGSDLEPATQARKDQGIVVRAHARKGARITWGDPGVDDLQRKHDALAMRALRAVDTNEDARAAVELFGELWRNKKDADIGPLLEEIAKCPGVAVTPDVG